VAASVKQTLPSSWSTRWICGLIALTGPALAVLNARRAPPHLLRRNNLAPAALLREAAASAGADVGLDDEPLGSALARLTAALRANDRLTLLGRWAAHADLRALLANRTRILAAAGRRGAADQPIVRPIFITGLPRTGTTLLHRLLAQDPRHRAPLTWEIMQPAARLAASPGRQAAAIARAETQLCWFRNLAREVDSAHTLGALEAEECIAITAHSLMSPRFHTMYWIPEYEHWLQSVDKTPAYAMHRRFLEQLQSGAPPGRWVLKAPAHLESLDALLRIYPDAIVVQTHREPHTAMGSVANLTRILQSAFQTPPEPRRIGDQVMRRWSRILRTGLAQRPALRGRGARFVDVDYDALVSDPIAALQPVYAAAGSELTPDGEARMRAYLASAASSRAPVHEYDGEVYGVTQARVQREFADYYDALATLRGGRGLGTA